MKNVKTLIAAAILSSMSFASFAAVEVQSTPEGQQKVGTISANAGTNLGSLEEQLAQKADEMGAKSFRITSVTGPNTLHDGGHPPASRNGHPSHVASLQRQFVLHL